jgi:dTMP kinase
MSLFVTFEGPEGSGKSTQARLLYSYLHARGYPVVLVREPGGTRIGDLIRRIVLDLQHTEMADTTEMLLFSAARAQLVNQVIRPYLDQGGIVLCDRYADSTYAYQGYGLGRPTLRSTLILLLTKGWSANAGSARNRSRAARLVP